jgi:phosphoglycerol transferase MdoB-like AlkP superfamily enzyme
MSQVVERPKSEVLENCLPSRLRTGGYRTLYIHGFTSAMFDRHSWTNRVGFSETLFHPQLRQFGLPDCGGPFRGTCDDAIGEWIGRRLKSEAEQKHFISWLTLNSHLPVTADRDSSAILGCGTPTAKIEGDHAPPFIRRSRRDNFSSTQVPFVHLVPLKKLLSPKQQ